MSKALEKSRVELILSFIELVLMEHKRFGKFLNDDNGRRHTKPVTFVDNVLLYGKKFKITKKEVLAVLTTEDLTYGN